MSGEASGGHAEGAPVRAEGEAPRNSAGPLDQLAEYLAELFERLAASVSGSSLADSSEAEVVVAGTTEMVTAARDLLTYPRCPLAAGGRAAPRRSQTDEADAPDEPGWLGQRARQPVGYQDGPVAGARAVVSPSLLGPARSSASRWDPATRGGCDERIRLSPPKRAVDIARGARLGTADLP